LNRLWLSSGLRRTLNNYAAWAEIVHANGLWLMPNVYPADAARRAGKPFVVSPRGTLNPVALRRSRLRKQAFWAFLQGRALRRASLLHATSEQEYSDIRRFGLRQPVAIVPNGVDLPRRVKRQIHTSEYRTLLYFGRIHPIKGLENLLRAWHRLASRHPDWQLKVIGPDEGGYRTALERLAKELAVCRVLFAGPRFGPEKQGEYESADLYVLPSFTENFGMTVAEALAHGVPVVTTTGTPWNSLPKHGCGWTVPASVNGLETALLEALSLDPSQLVAMGERGRAWMEHDFSWHRIAAEFEQALRWVIAGGSPPGFVIVS